MPQHAHAAPDRPGARDGRRWTVGQHLALSFYWFSQNFHWGALLTVALPSEVLRIVGEAQKGWALGLLLSIGAFMAMVTQPLAGAASDRSLLRWGRRRPFMAVGTVLACLALLGMAFASEFRLYVLAFVALQLTLNISSAGYQGLIPDLVPADQRGTASGYMGLMTMLGTLVGLFVAGVLLDQGLVLPLYVMLISILMLGLLVTLLFVREQPLTEREPFDWRRFWAGFWISPRQQPDFAWLFVTRAVAMLGFYTLLNFLEYYLRDVAGRTDFELATSIVGAVVMVGAAASTLLSGTLSDRVDRRLLVSLAAALMGLTALVFVTAPPFWLILAFAVVFGVGYGAFTSVDWALAVDVLPAARDAGKDLGVWSISTTLPQVVAPLLGGLLLDRYTDNLPGGYAALYVCAGVFFLLGAAGVWKIRRRQPV